MSVVNVSTDTKSSSFWRLAFVFIGVRILSVVLLFLDVIWFGFLLLKIVLCSLLQVCYLGSSAAIQMRLIKSCILVRRSLVCALCLFVALFSPSFGITIGCVYFLMYDKQGVDEMVPTALKKQFGDMISLCKEQDQSLGS
ncbi:MAG: hypothetical protein JSS09_01770 [Verrucomicrobia bacterium]|nr:hypothetical protein [Verrucomicrobiota bacterium]